jgi:hypothetical protein
LSRGGPDETEVPDELRDRLEELVAAYRAVRKKEEYLRKRVDGKTAPLRMAMGELIDRYNARLARLTKRRNEIISDFLGLWSGQLPDVRQLVLPSAVVRRRRDIKVVVLDKQKVIDALDRLDRLDLVDEVVDEKGLRGLVREGKLDDLRGGAIEIEEAVTIQPYRRKER